MAPDPVYNERLRICRELHDGPVQEILTALLTLRTTSPATHGADTLCHEHAIAALEKALDSARGFISRIRSRGAYREVEASHGQRLSDFIDQVVRPIAMHGGIRMHVRADSEIAAPALLLDDLGEILRELTRNVVRHAAATTLEIIATRCAGAVTIDLLDDGSGFTSAASRGFGIVGIAERAALLGGAVIFTSRHGFGTHVRVIVPSESSRRRFANPDEKKAARVDVRETHARPFHSLHETDSLAFASIPRQRPWIAFE